MGSRQHSTGPSTRAPWTAQDSAQSWCKEAAAPRWVPNSGKRYWCGQTQRPLQGRVTFIIINFFGLSFQIQHFSIRH
ncbi:hypothetical protein BLNAU_22200 [Blattamonas nauphoetae]|uniref:Uncharacterized protein n=1 Tax=Blattamonas nauphoetae TaxID=2049346 RepID=A0ABQ9WTQ7_9EUKA|nr:hypothetical protein BLNAU_22200 [Blattamonas nauphoetae]